MKKETNKKKKSNNPKQAAYRFLLPFPSSSVLTDVEDRTINHQRCNMTEQQQEETDGEQRVTSSPFPFLSLSIDMVPFESKRSISFSLSRARVRPID